MSESEPPLAPWLDPLWERVRSDWSDEAAHQAILAQCDRPDRLELVARRYREASADADRAPLAKRQLERITGLAFGQLTPRPRPKEPGQAWKIAWLLLLLAGVIALATRL